MCVTLCNLFYAQKRFNDGSTLEKCVYTHVYTLVYRHVICEPYKQGNHMRGIYIVYEQVHIANS